MAQYFQNSALPPQFYPSSYTTATPNFYNVSPGAVPQQSNTNSGSLMTIFVSSEDEVKNYPVAPGLTVMLISFNLQKFWLKSTNTNGVPETAREFSFTEKLAAPETQKIQNGVTREEFDSLSKKIDKLIEDLGGK